MRSIPLRNSDNVEKDPFESSSTRTVELQQEEDRTEKKTAKVPLSIAGLPAATIQARDDLLGE